MKSGGAVVGVAKISGGTLLTDPHAVERGGFVLSNGTNYVYSGGLAFNMTIGNAASMVLIGGAVAQNTTIGSGGLEFVYAGGLEHDAHLLQGGTLTLQEFGFVTSATAQFAPQTDVLTVSAGGIVDTLHLSGDYTGQVFHAQGGFGVSITVTTA